MYKLSIKEKDLIKTWNSTHKEPVVIKYIKSGLKEDKSIENFLLILADTVPNLTIKNENKRDNNLPEIKVDDNIIFSSVPLLNELEPFLNALSIKNKDRKEKLSQKIWTDLERVDIPIKLKLFVAQECPHCPIMVEKMINIASECKNIELHIIDPAIFTEEATANSIMSVPCLVSDDDYRWTGSVPIEEIVDVLINRDVSTLKAVHLRRILEDGKASWLAEQMLAKDMIFPEFTKLVLHEIWSVRLGAIVVIEEIAEVNMKLANTVTPLLWEQFSKAPEDVKGDIFYVMGEAGSIDDKDLIEKELESIETEELQEAGEDAIETIESRY